MLKVRSTKDVTIRQMQNMAENLREKLNTYVSIVIDISYYSDSKRLSADSKYKIYIESNKPAWAYFTTWKQLQIAYHKLM